MRSNADEPTPTSPVRRSGSLRDVRYCEVLPSVVEGDEVVTHVYNTTGLNDCPAPLWDQLTAESVNEAYGSAATVLNGPRHWTMDAIESSGVSATGRTFTFGGIEMALGATITRPVDRPVAAARPYTPLEVARDTVWIFRGGRPIFTLTDPDGDVYVMQSYALIRDRTLTYDQLTDLGSRLQLPDGWTYGTRVPDEDLRLSSGGLAHIVQDDLYDTYQRWDP
jgi:hypothetical protein